MVSPQVFILLLLGSAGVMTVQSMAIYLRSFKREPFLIQSVLTAVSTVLFSCLALKKWGSAGAAFTFLLSSGVLGLVSGTMIFRRWTQRAQSSQELSKYRLSRDL
jgi:hypothetical protein